MRKSLFFIVLIISLSFAARYPDSWYKGDDNALMNTVMPRKIREWGKMAASGECPLNTPNLSFTPCRNGKAGEYDCSNVDMLSFIPLKELGCNGAGNDIWGWTDPQTSREYAIFCCFSGTSFIDVTNPTSPVVIGFMPTTDKRKGSTWRDAKVFNNHVYVVSEEKNHGMQVFDLTKLRQLNGHSIVTLTPETTYKGGNGVVLGSVHNMVINEDSGFGYAVGSKTCSGGLHMIDLNSPKNPTFAGCYAADGYTHDAECVNYDGPDSRYTGHEICFNYNENTITIVDVTNKADVRMLSRTPYHGSQYTHQGWLLKDKRHLLANDELDEVEGTSGVGGEPGHKTRTMKWNVDDLEKPHLVGSFISTETAIDHNLYIIGDTAYLANYCAGLRILDVKDIENANEVAFFDVCPTCNSNQFLGSWSSYPYFSSGSIVVSSIERGLFVLKHNQ